MKNFYLFLTYVFGTIIAFLGLLIITFYFSFSYISPLIESIFSIKINLTYALFYIALSFLLSGFFMGIYSITKSSSEKSKFWIFFSSMFALGSFGFQLYKLAILGPTWIGIEFFGTNGNKLEAMYISGILFLINFLSLVVSFSVFWAETKKE
ncbi:hypothetical protein [Thermosipho atlanticus]|uniref:Uncharacterized protein n=1 Tax=Thermosipho atlanticus DSM 15807 TaxID=1123380 RepID=A0A1M5SN13_9BACT|nr:hypothetical protein [Thermosipho atlanticus]SHH39343.1 hypothetical protein SAMN02745199_0941 [Thermosipho atlanticus DSM 15807]